MRPRVAGRTLTLTAALVAVLAAPAAAAPAPHGSPAGSPATGLPSGTAPTAAVRESYQVTLVTGDVVRLDVRTDGTPSTTVVRPAPRSSGYHQYVANGDAFVVPNSAEMLLAAGRLDQALFDVSGLVAQGYDDTHRDTLPLLATYTAKSGVAPNLAAAPVPAGARAGAVLAPVRGRAMAESKKDATAFWANVAGGTAPAAGRTAAPALAGGLGKIWLDARVHATLDQSVPQIGAPAAWARGYDGTGTTVAVLDSGIDATHPDFAGRVDATQDFVGTGDVTDHTGHGTHVASILAGSGAASGGKYRGVAPGAHLLVGKVLDDTNGGPTSAVIAGMQWAAAHHASIVNASLGGAVTAGDDPMSQAVDTLSRQYGTLFVVAAGNHGPFEPDSGAVTAPASADDALAVGSVSKQDRMASDSRHGRLGDTAVKPEIVAPGMSITAARARGTGFGDDPYYTTQGGTSAAAPHVAGSAALLLEEHPGWGYAALRDALVSTAEPIAGAQVSSQGAGRVDVDRATRQQVFTDTPTLDLGYYARPFDPARMTTSRTVGYRNAGTAPVTLSLSTTLTDRNGQEPPTDGALRVSPATLTLAPGESGTATVTLDATDLSPSTYGGRVVASDGADLSVGTAVEFYKQDDTADLTLRAIGRDGKPAVATLRLAPYKKEDFGKYFPDTLHIAPGATETVVRVPEGDYNLWADVLTLDASGRFVVEHSIMGIPRIQAHTNATFVLDARTARPVSLTTPKPTEVRSFTLSWFRGTAGTPYHSFDSMGVRVGDGSPERVSVAGTDRVDDAPFVETSSFDAGTPVLTATSDGQRLDAVWEGGPPIDARAFTATLADAGSATPADLEGHYFFGKAALVREDPAMAYDDQVRAVVARGARMVLLYSAQPGVFWPAAGGTRTVVALPKDQGDALHARLAAHRTVTVTFDGQPRTPYSYDVAFPELGRVPDQLAYTVQQGDLAEVDTAIGTTGTGEMGSRLYDFQYGPCSCDAGILLDDVPALGYTRTEYVTARPDVQVLPLWEFDYGSGPGDMVFPTALRTYRPGQRVAERLLGAPFSTGPSNSSFHPFGATHATTRNGDRIRYDVEGWRDSAGNWTPLLLPTRGTSRLYRDGTLVASSPSLLTGSGQVPAEPATYRLETDVTHDGSLFGLSTRTSSVWTFGSAHADGTTTLPLVDVGYAEITDRSGTSILDVANTAPAGQEATLVLRAGHQAGAQAPDVASVTAWVSFDDGTTWTKADAARAADGTFHARYRHPKAGQGSGFVSLRVSAADPDGNTLDQTVVRAYRLR